MTGGKHQAQSGQPSGKKEAKKKAPARRSKPVTLRKKGSPVPSTGTIVALGSNSSDAKQFRTAMLNPFSPMAIGARVTDAFSMPSVTYHIRSSFSCSSDASGNFVGVFLPSPCLTFILGSGSAVGGTSFSQNAAARYLQSPTGMYAAFQEYRTVSWGLRILAKDTALASKGKITIAVVPTSRNAPSWNTLETVTAANLDTISLYCCGLGVSQPATFVNHPSSRVLSMQDLLRREVQVCGVPFHNSYYEYKGTQDRVNLAWNAGQVLADEGVFNNTTGLVNATSAGRKDVASLAGGSAIAIYLNGAPATSNEFDVELIYHLEGTPTVQNTTFGALVPSSMRSTTGSTSLVEAVMTAAHTAGAIVRVVNDALTPGATKPVMYALKASKRLALTY